MSNWKGASGKFCRNACVPGFQHQMLQILTSEPGQRSTPFKKHLRFGITNDVCRARAVPMECELVELQTNHSARQHLAIVSPCVCLLNWRTRIKKRYTSKALLPFCGLAHNLSRAFLAVWNSQGPGPDSVCVRGTPGCCSWQAPVTTLHLPILSPLRLLPAPVRTS